MIDTARRDEFEQVAGQISNMLSQVHRHFGEFCPTDRWTPPVNLYRLERRLEVCVDLAGVHPRALEVRLEPGRLIIRGFRASPEPRRHGDEALRIVTMEIDHGPFCRTVALPDQVDLGKVRTQYTDGLLWVSLPFREQG